MYQSKMKSEETDHLFKAILSLKTEEECYRFFDDLCTFSEIEAMSQRFEVASLLADGKTFTQISQKIGVSSTTITRVKKIYDVSAVSLPADPNTEISARNLLNGVIEKSHGEHVRRKNALVKARAVMAIATN